MKQLKPATLPPRRPIGARPLPEGLPQPDLPVLPPGLPPPPPGMPAIPLAARAFAASLETPAATTEKMDLPADNPVVSSAPPTPPVRRSFFSAAPVPESKPVITAAPKAVSQPEPVVPITQPKTAPPKWRYFTTPPTHVSLALGDLAVPETHRTPEWDNEFVVQLPCDSVFASPVPKISLARLTELFPDRISAEGMPEIVTLPAVKLSHVYSLVEQAERLPEPEPEPPAEEINIIPTAIAPAVETMESPVSEEAAPAPVESTMDIEEQPAFVPEPFPREEAPQAVVPSLSEPAPVEPPVIPPLPEVVKIPARRPTLFSGLPLFRRKAVAVAPEPIAFATPEPVVVEVPVQLPPLPPPGAIPDQVPAFPLFQRVLPPEDAVSSVPAEEPVPFVPDFAPPTPVFPAPPLPFEQAPSFADEPVSPAPFHVAPPASAFFVPPAPFVESTPLPVEGTASEPPAEEVVPTVFTEHLPRQQVAETGSQEQLQALFMTEEVLTVQRVVELCGSLPGVKSCILARRGAVIASHNVPANIDPVSLSSHGMEMLQAMRDSSLRMGLGTIPAVTVHSEKGHVSFLQHDLLCFLVLHRERAFIPGVREKLSDVLREITRANLQLPVSGQSG